MFLSLQRGSCDSPKLCSSSEGLGQDTESPALLLLCEGGFAQLRGAEAAAGGALGCMGAPGSFHPALLWQRATGCPRCWETMERKALIPAVMDTLLLQGGADGRNWGLGYLLLSFVNRW